MLEQDKVRLGEHGTTLDRNTMLIMILGGFDIYSCLSGRRLHWPRTSSYAQEKSSGHRFIFRLCRLLVKYRGGCEARTLTIPETLIPCGEKRLKIVLVGSWLPFCSTAFSRVLTWPPGDTVG